VSSPHYTTGAGASNNSVMLVPNGNNMAPVNIVGFLQVFIQQVNSDGQFARLCLETCRDVEMGSAGVPLALTPLDGTSPVPIRLVTPPSP